MSERLLLKAIRQKCLWCSAARIVEVRLCPVKDCPLYPHRLGENSGGPKTTQKTHHSPVKDSINKKLDVGRPKLKTTGQVTSKHRTKRPQMPLTEKQGIVGSPKGRKSPGGHAGGQGLRDEGVSAL